MRLAGLALILAATSAAFALIAGNISEGAPLAMLDARVANWLHVHAFPLLTYALLVITHLHGPVAVCIYAAAFAYVLMRRRLYSWLVALVFAVPLGLAINRLLKEVFERARPVFESPLASAASFSFPSGHTAGTVLFYGVLAAYGFTRATTRGKRTAWLLLWFTAVSLVGFSRMYLGVHYLSDILGAAAWAFAWLALSLYAAPHVARALRRT